MDPASKIDPISQAIALLLTPMGLGLILSGLILTLSAMVSPKARWGTFGMMLWASALGTGVTDASDVFQQGQLMFPLESLRDGGRTITVGLLLVLICAAIISPRGWRRRLVMSGTIAYFVFQLVFCLRTAAAGLVARAAGAALVYAVLFIVATYGLPRWMQTLDDAYAALRSIAFTGIIFAFTNMAQVIVNRAAAGINGRFSGTAGNPQHAATCIAAMLPAVFTLVVRKQESKPMRILLACTVPLLLLLLGMTGSRTGFMMLIVGVVVLYRKRLGGFIKLLLVAMVGLLLVLAVFPNLNFTTEHFTSAQDTRSEVWATLWQQFLDHPLMGVMEGTVSVRENSYLSTAARVGLFGLVPMIITIFLIVRAIRQTQKIRPLLGDQAALADVAIAGLVSLAAGAITEGYLLATLSIHLVLIYLYLAIFGFIADYVEQVLLQPETEIAVEYDEFAEWEELAYND